MLDKGKFKEFFDGGAVDTEVCIVGLGATGSIAKHQTTIRDTHGHPKHSPRPVEGPQLAQDLQMA